MRAVLQRIDGAHVIVEGEEVGRIDGPGLLALVAATHTDAAAEVETMTRKIAELRLLEGERSVEEAGAGVLVVSQFTLYGSTRKGRRPSWSDAAPGAVAEPLVDAVAAGLRDRGLTVATGRFGAHMKVHLCNDGPFTVIVDV
ncbi:MAG: D-aminoacyl-tRNA deacylase [Mobilicoccus sp.]|nr:D-aminoacyl-tRNA deacylase [Mobilicoccus sp.]